MLVVGCALPRTDCVPSADPLLSIKERNPGRERLRLDLKKLVPQVTQSQFGDPAMGTTRFEVCIYDDADRLDGSLTVDRAGQSCGDSSTACWQPIGAKGYRYNDRRAVADGVRNIVAKGGAPGRGKVIVKARNDARHGQQSLPVGIAAALQSTRSVTVQAVTSDGACFGATLTDVHANGRTSFRAK
jgi:hypothetical protein